MATRWQSAHTRWSAARTRKMTIPNYGSEWAILDVYKGGKQIGTMTPDRRFYQGQPADLDHARHSLYAERRPLHRLRGVNQDTGHPILKAHLNPLVMWIWMGVWIMLIGTILALVPNAPAPVRVPASARLEPAHAAPVATGD